MKDVTNQFKLYRECVRHLWNTYFESISKKERAWDIRDEFDEISRSIFSSLVLNPLGIFNCKISAASSAKPLALPNFQIVPNSESGAPILINRDLPRSGYWDHPISEVKPSDVELHLLRFFDFDELNFRDFRYYEVVIQASKTHPEIIGRVALIEVEYTKVLFDEK
jgi:hypothetical protein